MIQAPVLVTKLKVIGNITDSFTELITYVKSFMIHACTIKVS